MDGRADAATLEVARPRARPMVRLPGRKGGTKRIFIDCSFVNFQKQPTGIPRVVLKYIEVGYAWGKRRDIPVIPVVPARDGFFLCRPLPGAGAPEALAARVRTSEERDHRSALADVVGAMLGYAQPVVHHLLWLLASLLPLPPVRATATWIDTAVKRWCGAWQERRTRLALERIRYTPSPGDVLFAPAYWHDVAPEIYQSFRAAGVTVVILVHDLLPIMFENFYPSPWRYAFRDNVREAFGYASALFCVSNFTRQALTEFGQRQKCRPVPIMTAYNGFEPLVPDATAAQIRQGAVRPVLGNARLVELVKQAPLLMVGSVEPKKGHIPVIQCLEAMWSVGYERPLLIIGRTGWMEREVVAAIEGSAFHNRKLFWFTNIDDFDLATAYIFCHALVFSSLAEGFGIPMIEAAYYGKPTLAYDTPIVREVLGEHGLRFTTAHSFMGHLSDLEDGSRYAAACAAAEQLNWPSWDDYTPHVFDQLARLADHDDLPEQITVQTGLRQAAPVVA